LVKIKICHRGNRNALKVWIYLIVYSIKILTNYLKRVREVTRWEAVSDDMDYFENNYPEGIYDSQDHDVRNIIPWNTLHEYPLEDDNGCEIPWYSIGGFVIKRRAGIYSSRTKPHGILFNLPKLADLFIQDDDLFGERPIKYHVYPQAGLLSIGHFQADGIMVPFSKVLDDLNHKLMDLDDNNGCDENNNLRNHNDLKPITGISCQAYNQVIHRTRGHDTQHHEVQIGLVTSTLGGVWATSNASKRKAAILADRCSQALPHYSFSQKIQDNDVGRDLRLENVYYIDINALDEENRTGR
jgi:hypothetical protein